MAGAEHEIIETSLSDRQILLHILTHVEELAELVALVEEFRPLLNLVKAQNGNGKLDYVGLAQIGRGLRKAARGGP